MGHRNQTIALHSWFWFLWGNQGVQSIASFLEFKQRFVDCNTQSCYGHLTNSQRFEMYRNDKTRYATELYLALDLKEKKKKKHLVNALTRFRMSLSITEPHMNRCKCLSPKKLLCPMCKTSVETDVLFLLVCSAYEYLRAQLIPQKYFRHPYLFRFVSLMKTQN